MPVQRAGLFGRVGMQSLPLPCTQVRAVRKNDRTINLDWSHCANLEASK